MYWLFGTLVYLDAKLPRPVCSLLSLKEEGGGRKGSGGAGGEGVEGGEGSGNF